MVFEMELVKKGPQEDMIYLSVNFTKPFHEISLERVKPTRNILFDLLFLNKRYLNIIVNLAFVAEERDRLSNV